MAAVAFSTVNSYSTGLFIAPLEQQFGWTRGQISLGPAITAPIIIIMAPLAGAIIDRFGPRRVGMIGVASLFAVNLALSQTGPSIYSWWAIWAVMAFANIFIQPMVWTSAVSSVFAAGRGLALAVTLSGSGIGSILTPMLAYALIERFGWRWGYVGLALFWGAIAIPLVFFLFTSSKDRARVARQAGAEPARPDPGTASASRRAQLASRQFIQLAVAGLFIAWVVMSTVTNLVPLLSSRGLTREEAAMVAPMLGLSAIVGRLTIGFLLDHINGSRLAAFAVCLPVLTCGILLAVPGSVPLAIVAVLVLGLALGAELDLVSYLTTRYFGLANFGLLFGTIGGLITLAGAAGPLVMNMAFDATQSYNGVLWAYIPVCLAAALLFLTLGRYPDVENLD